jgi:hypothetical protein
MLSLEGSDEHAGAGASQLPRELTAGAIGVRPIDCHLFSSRRRRWEKHADTITAPEFVNVNAKFS